MTVPVAVEALVPLSVAVSVTAVPVGTLMLVPLCPPPESEVDKDVDAGGVDVGAVPLPGSSPRSSPSPTEMLNGAEKRWG